MSKLRSARRGTPEEKQTVKRGANDGYTSGRKGVGEKGNESSNKDEARGEGEGLVGCLLTELRRCSGRERSRG